MGRGATGRLFTFELLLFELLPGRELVFREFTLARGMSTALFAFAFAGRLLFVFLLPVGLLMLRLPFAFALAFSFAFRFLGRLGLLSLAEEFVLRFVFALSSAGGTVSGDSPSFVARLMSIATVWPVFTTSPARGN